MLSFIYTENYKNLKFTEKVILKNLNILIGPNGSGKSNFISYLNFFHQYFKRLGNSPDNATNTSPLDYAVATLNRILDVQKPTPEEVRMVLGYYTKGEKSESIILDLDLYIYESRSPVTITRQSLYQGFDLKEKRQASLFYYDSSEPQKIIGLLKNSNIQQMVLGNQENKTKALEYQYFFAFSYANHWRFYNANSMNLEMIRTSEPKIGPSDIYLSSSGDNLALVMDNLSQDLDFEDAIDLAMKSIFPKTRRIRSARVGRLSLTIEWFLEGNNEPFYLDEMSDGTVRMLCWAVILHSPQLPPLLVIDEPELGLHPAWLSVLAQWIKQAAEKTQIILTTHSPDLLDHFTDRLENVYCFDSIDANHYSMRPLALDILKPQLDEGWELGDLYRIGEPTLGGWPW